MNPTIIEGVKRAVRSLVESYPELADDAGLRADMIEGETDLHRIASRLVLAKVDADAMAASIKAIRQDYADRQGRYEAKADAARQSLAEIMAIADLPKLELPEATVSRMAGKNSVEITNSRDLPQGFFEIERKPLKLAIKAALHAGENVPGARMVTGPDTITVRVK